MNNTLLHTWIGDAQYLACQFISDSVSVCCLQYNCFCALFLLRSFHLKLTHILSKTGMIIRCWKTCYQQVCFPVSVKLSILSILNAHKHPSMASLIFLEYWPGFQHFKYEKGAWDNISAGGRTDPWFQVWSWFLRKKSWQTWNRLFLLPHGVD